MQQKTTGKNPSRAALRQKRKKIGGLPKKGLLEKAFREFPNFRPCKKHLRLLRLQRLPFRHIVIHTMGTPINKVIENYDNLPYHFVITRNGRLKLGKELTSDSQAVEIALVGGLNKSGKHCDTRTTEQSEALFTVLSILTEVLPDADIVGADQIYVYNHVNPGFNVKEWLNEYIPEFLQNSDWS